MNWDHIFSWVIRWFSLVIMSTSFVFLLRAMWQLRKARKEAALHEDFWRNYFAGLRCVQNGNQTGAQFHAEQIQAILNQMREREECESKKAKANIR